MMYVFNTKKTKKLSLSLKPRLPSPSPIQRLVPQVRRDLGLPPVPVVQQLLLVVQQLLPRLGAELKVGPLDNRVDGARLLAEAAVNALGHVDVVARGPAAAVLALLGLDGDGLCRADGLAELAGNAALLARRVPPQHVLPAEARREGSLFERVVDGCLFLEEGAEGQGEASPELGEEEGLGGLVQDCCVWVGGEGGMEEVLFQERRK